jgi:hypothetical protein
MLCRQFLISALRPAHPNYSVILHPPGPRKMKKTLASKYLHTVDKYLQDGIVHEVSFKRILNSIHSETIKEVIESLVPNPVLQAPVPPVSCTEQRLSGPFRCLLAQLRSDKCVSLKTYQYFLNKSNLLFIHSPALPILLHSLLGTYGITQ